MCQELGGEELIRGQGRAAENLPVWHTGHVKQLSGRGQRAFAFTPPVIDAAERHQRGSVGRRPAPADRVAEVYKREWTLCDISTGKCLHTMACFS